MSANGWKFKDRKSAVVTIVTAVIIFLILGYIGKWNTRHQAETRYQGAMGVQNEMSSLMDSRFLHLKSLSSRIDDRTLTAELDDIVSRYESDLPFEKRCELYRRSDSLLLPLMKEVAERPDYLALQPYFTRLGEIEDALEPLSVQYRYVREQALGFDDSLALENAGFGQAFDGRP